MEILIPIVGISVVGFFAFAMAATARRQREAKREAFRSLAETMGLSYIRSDDGAAQRFAADFDAIGRFRSNAGGSQIPQDVVSGRHRGRGVIAFRHFTRFSDQRVTPGSGL